MAQSNQEFFFPANEKVINYVKTRIKSFKLEELKDIISDNFDKTFDEILEQMRKRKLHLSKENLSELLLHDIRKEKWSNADILETAFNLELEYIVRYHNRFNWVGHAFSGSSDKTQITDLGSEIRRAIRNEQKDALVLTKQTDGFFLISVVMKDLKSIGLYKKPYYIALSECAKYFFIKTVPHDNILEIFQSALGYDNFKKIKLSGRNLKCLVKLREKRLRVDLRNRPVFKGGEAVENAYGVDMTMKKCYEDYYNECVDNDDDIEIQHYTITPVNCTWMGDGPQMLKQMEFNSSMRLSGNVARIIKAMPSAGILTPPFPDFFVNFSVAGKNRVKTMGMQHCT